MDIPSWAKVGAKVVCISADPRMDQLYPWDNNMDGLSGRQIYTIRDIFFDPTLSLNVRLREIDRGIDYSQFWGGVEPGYLITRFRPLVTRTQSEDVAAIISLVNSMPISEELDRLERELNRA